MGKENDARELAETAAIQDCGPAEDARNRLYRLALAGRGGIAGACAYLGDFLCRLAAHLEPKQSPAHSPSGLESIPGSPNTAAIQNRTDIHRGNCRSLRD